MRKALQDSGVRVGTERVGKSLKRVIAVAEERLRQNKIDEVNPFLNDDHYFGKILHLDQNEDLGVFRVTYVTALDDYSGKIVAAVAMPRKNDIVIYDRVYRYKCIL